MNYWQGYMNWPLNKDWVCPTCGGNHGLEWGLVHAECRCNECHTIFTMRQSDAERTITDTPICHLKDEYVKPAQLAWAKYQIPVDYLTEEQWDEFMSSGELIGRDTK